MNAKTKFLETFIWLKPNEKKELAHSIFAILAEICGEKTAWIIMRYRFGIDRMWLPVLEKREQDLSDIPAQTQQARPITLHIDKLVDRIELKNYPCSECNRSRKCSDNSMLNLSDKCLEAVSHSLLQIIRLAQEKE